MENVARVNLAISVLIKARVWQDAIPRVWDRGVVVIMSTECTLRFMRWLPSFVDFEEGIREETSVKRVNYLSIVTLDVSIYSYIYISLYFN